MSLFLFYFPFLYLHSTKRGKTEQKQIKNTVQKKKEKELVFSWPPTPQTHYNNNNKK